MEVQYLLEIKNGISLIAGFNNLLLIYVLIRHFKTSSPANLFLILFFLGMGMVNLMMYLYDTHIMENIPWLFRVPSPLYYLMFPCAWLYVRMLVNDENRLRPRDYWHFLPAALHLVEMVPYYFTSIAHKKQHLLDSYANPMGNYQLNEGVLPNYLHNAIRGLIGLMYCGFILQKLHKTFKKDNPAAYAFGDLRSWLYLFVYTTGSFSLIVFVSFSFPQLLPGAVWSLLVELSTALTQIMTFVTLLRWPNIMYGIPKPPPVPVKIEKPEPFEKPTQYEKYVAALNEYSETQTSFLAVGFSIGALSKELDIPQHHLSYVLNQVLHIRFNDYVNGLRIQYLKKQVSAEKLKSFTLEGLASEGGFGNRATFIRAVKKATGQNPSQFFNTSEKWAEENSAESLQKE